MFALHYEGGFGVILVCVHLGEYACVIPVRVRMKMRVRMKKIHEG